MVDDEQGFNRKLLSELTSDDVDVLKLLNDNAIAIEQDISKAKLELDTSRTEMEQIWEGDQQDEYELSSVFIHLGAAGYGHYYCMSLVSSLSACRYRIID